MNLNLNWKVHSSPKGDPGDLLLINLSTGVLALCLYLGETRAMVAFIILFVTYSLPLITHNLPLAATEKTQGDL